MRGIALEERGESARAEENYRRAINWDRRWSVPWYNLGLLYKQQGNWTESLRHNRRAVELDSSDEAAWWNLGIAATALGEWHEARAAWRACGIDIPEGDGPPNLDFGLVPIRLDPAGCGEVVWCSRIDPARAVIRNVPLPDSDRRCGDVVLHDGARKGTRRLEGVEVPVFDELALLQPSELGTFIVEISGLSASAVEALTTRAVAEGVVAEDWTANITMMCQACSEGSVEHTHDEVTEPRDRRIGIAASSEAAVRGLVEPFVASASGATIDAIECALPPLPVQ